jgi:hypothetical protein
VLFSEPELRALEDCEAFARAAHVQRTDSWSGEDHVVIAGRAEGRPVELVWFPVPAVERLLDQAFAGELVDHGRLRIAEALEHGIGLRSDGRLAEWQRRLQRYPDMLAAKLIETALSRWVGYPPEAYLNIVRRPDRLPLERNLVEASELILRLLFALNRRWEPSWKRIALLVEPLPLKPERVAERIEEALLEPQPVRALGRLLELAREVVDLVEQPDVATARDWLGEAIELLR